MSEDREALRKGVSDVQAALDELMGALDFKYPLAGQLYPLYSYCKRLFSTVLYSLDVSVVDEADVIMKSSETALKQRLPMTNRLRLWTMRRRSMRA